MALEDVKVLLMLGITALLKTVWEGYIEGTVADPVGQA